MYIIHLACPIRYTLLLVVRVSDYFMHSVCVAMDDTGVGGRWCYAFFSGELVVKLLCCLLCHYFSIITHYYRGLTHIIILDI